MKMTCRCGKQLDNSTDSNVQLRVYSTVEWDKIVDMGISDLIDVPFPRYDVWECSYCGRQFYFEWGKDTCFKVYKIEEHL